MTEMTSPLRLNPPFFSSYLPIASQAIIVTKIPNKTLDLPLHIKNYIKQFQTS